MELMTNRSLLFSDRKFGANSIFVLTPAAKIEALKEPYYSIIHRKKLERSHYGYFKSDKTRLLRWLAPEDLKGERYDKKTAAGREAAGAGILV